MTCRAPRVPGARGGRRAGPGGRVSPRGRAPEPGGARPGPRGHGAAGQGARASRSRGRARPSRVPRRESGESAEKPVTTNAALNINYTCTSIFYLRRTPCRAFTRNPQRSNPHICDIVSRVPRPPLSSNPRPLPAPHHLPHRPRRDRRRREGWSTGVARPCSGPS